MSGVLATTHGILAGNSSGGGYAPTGLDLSGLSVAPYAWLDMTDTADMVLSGSELVSIPNKGSLGGSWTGSNASGTALPHYEIEENSTIATAFFHAFGTRLQLGTAADFKFLHDGTKYLTIAVVATEGNGGMIYSTIPWDLSGIGTFLQAGFWGSSWQNALTKGWKNPSLSWVSTETASNAMPGTAPPTFRQVTELMRGYSVSSGDKWAAYINNNATPLPGNSNNTLDTHMATETGVNPYQPLTVGHIANSELSLFGLRVAQLAIVKYAPGTTDDTLAADWAYAKTQTNALYNLY